LWELVEVQLGVCEEYPQAALALRTDGTSEAEALQSGQSSDTRNVTDGYAIKLRAHPDMTLWELQRQWHKQSTASMVGVG